MRYAVDQSPNVKIQTIDKNGSTYWRQLNLSQIDPNKLNENFPGIIGLTSYQPVFDPIIGQVIADGVGSRAGLQAGDEIIAANHTEILTWMDFVKEIRSNPKSLNGILRHGQMITHGNT